MKPVGIIVFVAILLLCWKAGIAESASQDQGGTHAQNLVDGAIPIKHFSFEQQEDLDYDRQPDDWIRRKGPLFREYINAEIDYANAADGDRSLRIDANGSSAVYYSQPIPVDPQYTYLLSASLLTQGLKYNAAMVSFSFLNHRKERISRYLTSPVSGSHTDWQELHLDPVIPDQSVRFIVIGCHLVASEFTDISGSVWFDKITIGKLPRVNLASNFETHFHQKNADINIKSYITGLDERHGDEEYVYLLQLHLEDVTGKELEQTTVKLHEAGEAVSTSKARYNRDDHSGETTWTLPTYPTGYYRVRAILKRNGMKIVSRVTSFAVLDLIEQAPEQGEFGWVLSEEAYQIDQNDMLAITRESGINWIKTPVWQKAYSRESSETGHLLTSLRNQSITPIGMLVDPPDHVRRKFAANWNGTSDLFTAPPGIWREAANQVMALYSPTVMRWQLGNDQDTSYVGLGGFSQTMQDIRDELQRIGQIRQLGVRWNIDTPVEKNHSLHRNFLTLIMDEQSDFETIRQQIQSTQSKGFEAWVIVKANRLQPDQTPNERANDMVRRMIDAKRAGADLIFAYEVFDRDFGLLNPDGSPSDLFLPWRSVSLALNHSTYAGTMRLPNGSQNHVFLRENDAAIAIWNEEPTEEEIYLGDNVYVNNVWGDRSPLVGHPEHGRQKISVSQVPTILTGCSKELALWRMSVRFKEGRIASSAAEHEDFLVSKNVFPWEIQGQAKIIPGYGWELLPQEFQLSIPVNGQLDSPFSIKLPSQTMIGEQLMIIEYDLGGSGISYPFRVYREYSVGMGDVRMEVELTRDEQGRLLVLQRIVNETDPAEILDFRCNLLLRGRRRMVRNMTGLVSGQRRKVMYVIPDFDSLAPKDLWLRAEQKNGTRLLNEMLTEEQVIKMLENKEEQPRQTGRSRLLR